MRPEDIAFGPGAFEVPAGRAAIRVSWLGTAGFRIEHDGFTLLIDPYVTRASLFACARAPLDLLLMCVAGWTTTARFCPRVMGAIRPGAILLSHWDNFFSPMDAGAKALPAMQMPRLVDGLTAVDPSVRIGTVPLLGSVDL